jgi:UDP-N-acetylglucosamine 2-epimerase (non-hydrolysing)
MKKVLTVVGTRPELIKMWSVLEALKQQPNVRSLLCLTGQHADMIEPVKQLFNIIPHYDIQLRRKRDRLVDLVAALLPRISDVLEDVKPSMVLVHGDTTTAKCAAEAAFYQYIPIGYVEAGLRTSRFEYPMPEEMNRRLITRLSTLFFAPTKAAGQNLYSEGITNNVFLTGNTVVDALRYVLKLPDTDRFTTIDEVSNGRKLILVTCHRRENWGATLASLCSTLKKFPHEYFIVFSVHANPAINKVVRFNLMQRDNISIEEQLDYNTFIKLLNRCSVVITDSGGVIEEASTLGKPLIILRDMIERPEALGLPTCTLFNFHASRSEDLYKLTLKWLDKDFILNDSTNLFGEGKAGTAIAEVVSNFLESQDDE